MDENPAPQRPDEVDHKVIKQLEYYFGNINLPRDKFLQEQIKKDEGWVPIATLLTFNRLAALTTDSDKIANAIKGAESDIVSVSEDLQKVRRNIGNPLPENSVEFWQKFKHRTVYMKGFSTETKLDEILNWAKQFGAVENVLMRRVKNDGTFKGNVFVTYKSREEAEAAQMSDAKFGEGDAVVELVKLMQNDYWTAKNKEKKELRAAKWAAACNKAKSGRFKKGLILGIDGLGEDASVPFIKYFFEKYGWISYIVHKAGQRTAQIKFIRIEEDAEGDTAKNVWARAIEAGPEGKVVFQGNELTGRVLEGEEEEKFWISTYLERSKKACIRRSGIRCRSKNSNLFFTCGDSRGGVKRTNKGDKNEKPKAKRIVFEDGDGSPAAEAEFISTEADAAGDTVLEGEEKKKFWIGTYVGECKFWDTYMGERGGRGGRRRRRRGGRRGRRRSGGNKEPAEGEENEEPKAERTVFENDNGAPAAETE